MLTRVIASTILTALLTARIGSAQCAGDCDASGEVAVDELVRMVNGAAAEEFVVACGAGDASVDGRISTAEIADGIRDLLGDCNSPSLRRSFDFRAGRQGWEAGFADYAPEMVAGLEIDAAPRELPAEIGVDGSGFLLSGNNPSDDLFMFLKRQLTRSDGIQPNRLYSVEYTIVFASAAPSDCLGIGGAPGESVYLKAGAASLEPVAALDVGENLVRMNIDKGNQNAGGVHASVAGNVANGRACDPGNAVFVSLRRQHLHTETVRASVNGDLWLLVGTDSAFEGTTALYYQRIDVRLTPARDPQRLEPSDVSILFPLPPAADRDALLSPTSLGVHGPLLPAMRYAAIPKLHVFQSAEQTYDLLRVIAARVDPCFRSGAACRRQIRLTMQPLTLDSTDGGVRAEDAAIHLFYDLTESGFTALLEELRQLKTAAIVGTAGPLRVHPILAAEGVRGAFADGLRATILRYAGGENLTRITFMQLQNFNVNEWVFGGFNIEGGMPVAIDIVDAAAQRQRFINVFLFSEEDFVASVEPRPLGADDISLLFNSSRAREATSAEVDDAVTAALRIENPDIHSTESVSCVACHVSTQTRLWAENNLGRTTDDHPDRFTADEDLALTSATTRVPGSLRAFGYLHRRVALGQRVVNESAAVVTRLNAEHFGQASHP